MTDDIEIKNINTNETLLTSIDNAGLGNEIHRGCLSGFCGDCRCTLVKGSVTYKEDPIAYIGEGEILPCISYPTSEHITIKSN
jgi:ferredoxin